MRHAGEVPAVVLRCNRMTYGEWHYPAKKSIKLYADKASGFQPSLDVYSGPCGYRGSTRLEQKPADMQGVTFCVCQQD